MEVVIGPGFNPAWVWPIIEKSEGPQGSYTLRIHCPMGLRSLKSSLSLPYPLRKRFVFTWFRPTVSLWSRRGLNPRNLRAAAARHTITRTHRIGRASHRIGHPHRHHTSSSRIGIARLHRLRASHLTSVSTSRVIIDPYHIGTAHRVTSHRVSVSTPRITSRIRIDIAPHLAYQYRRRKSHRT